MFPPDLEHHVGFACIAATLALALHLVLGLLPFILAAIATDN